MDRANTNLLLQNLCIMQQNEQLRKMSRQLDRENKALLAELQRKQQEAAAAEAAASQLQSGGHSADAAADLKATGSKKHK